MLSDITIGQYFPGNSVLHRMDPRAKIMATMLFIIAIFFADSLVTYSIVAAFTFGCMALSRLPLRLIWLSIKPLWVIIVFTLAIHVFTTPGEYLFSYGWLFLIVFSSLLTYTTSPIRLTDGIERLLNPWKRIGVPAHELAMMMTIALRFIPTLLEETDRIMKAQESRGADFTTGSLVKRAKNMVPLLVPLFISAFRRADELAVAMESRCYRGGEGRTRMKELSYSNLDFYGVGAVVVVSVLLAVLRWGFGI